jgi:AraC family transcriptional regulator, positive regulator of tynA and feaB
MGSLALQTERRWSTDEVSPPQRFDYWVGAICECFLEMDARTASPERFAAELSSVPLHTLVVNRVRGSAQDVFRTQRGIARSRGNYYYLLCKERSACGVVQHGAHAGRLMPGDLALIDSRGRYELHFPGAVDTYSLQIPLEWLDTWVPDARCHLGQRIDGSTGWGQALSACVRQLGGATGALPAALVADQLGALLALTLDPVTPADAPVRDLVSRIDDCLHSRCSEPGLHADDVAASLGISVRTLHRALARAQRTFAARLMHHRLQAARRMLESPAFDRLTLAEIGRRVGLLDPSHFTRVCRRALGRTPGELRASR